MYNYHPLLELCVVCLYQHYDFGYAAEKTRFENGEWLILNHFSFICVGLWVEMQEVLNEMALQNIIRVFSILLWPLLSRLMFQSLLLCDIVVTCPHY